MGMRREMRLRLALPVGISGTDAVEPLAQTCATVDLTVNGARVEGAAVRQLRRGDVVNLRNGAKVLPVRVVWSGKAGTGYHAGLQIVGGSGWNHFWGRAIPRIAGDAFQPAGIENPESSRTVGSGLRVSAQSSTVSNEHGRLQGEQFLKLVPQDGLTGRMSREPRLKLRLAVRLCGMDSSGRAFIEHATAENVSQSGARIAEVKPKIAKGSILVVSHGNCNARFRTVWSKGHRDRAVFEIGLRAVDLTRSIWGIDFSDARDECGAVERRSGQRYACAGAASIWHPAEKYFLRGRVADLSMSGCYVECMTTLNIGSVVVLMLNIGEIGLRTAAEVQTSHPGVGMGLRWVNMTPSDISGLQAAIANLDHSNSCRMELPGEDRPQTAAR